MQKKKRRNGYFPGSCSLFSNRWTVFRWKNSRKLVAAMLKKKPISFARNTKRVIVVVFQPKYTRTFSCANRIGYVRWAYRNIVGTGSWPYEVRVYIVHIKGFPYESVLRLRPYVLHRSIWRPCITRGGCHIPFWRSVGGRLGCWRAGHGQKGRVHRT